MKKFNGIFLTFWFDIRFGNQIEHEIFMNSKFTLDVGMKSPKKFDGIFEKFHGMFWTSNEIIL